MAGYTEEELKYKAPPPPPQVVLTSRPTLTQESVVEYIDWIAVNAHKLDARVAAFHMQAAELVIRTRATDAQGKATQHTLVEDGTIAPPPVAS